MPGLESEARLRLVIDTGDGIRAVDVLDRLENQSKQTEQAIDRLAGEINGLARSLDKAGDEAAQTDGQIDKLEKSGRRLGITFGDLRNILIAVGGIALFKKATESSVQFEAQIDRVGALVRGTADDMAGLEAITRQLGATTQFTATEAAQGAEALSLAGLEIQEIIRALPDTLNLSAIEDLEVGRAAEILGTTLNQFQEDADQASRVADALAAASTGAAVSVAELGEALKLTGGSARIAGLDVEGTTALLGKLADAGLKGSLGGTALNRLIQEFITPKADLEDLVGPIDLKAQGFEEVFQRVSSILTEEQAFEIFDERAARAFAFLKPVKDDVKALEDQIRSLVGVSQEMAQEVTDNTGGAARELASAVEAAFITFGSAGYLDGLEALFDELSDTIRDVPFQEFAEDAGQAFGDAAFAAAGFLAILRDIEDALPGDPGRDGEQFLPFYLNPLDSLIIGGERDADGNLIPDTGYAPFSASRAFRRLTQRGKDEQALRQSKAQLDLTEGDRQSQIDRLLGDPERRTQTLELLGLEELDDLPDKVNELAKALGFATDAQNDLNDAQGDGAKAIDQYNAQLLLEVDRLERLADASRQGPDVVAEVQRQIDKEIALEELKAKAKKEGKDFDEASASATIDRISNLEQEAELQASIFEIEQKRRQREIDKIAKGVQSDVDLFDERLDATDFAVVDPQRRQQLREQLKADLDAVKANFEIENAVLDDDQIADLEDAFDDASDKIDEAFRLGGQEAADRIRGALAGLTDSLFNDLIFNQGQGLGRIFDRVAQDGVNQAFINPLSDFLGGATDSEGNPFSFGDLFEKGLDEFTAKFDKIGNDLDELLGTDIFGSEGGGLFGKGGAFGGAAAGFAGFSLGGGAADLLNGSQGETGSKVGGAVGGGIGFAVAGPAGAFIGSAAGSFIGDLLGGLFGRKTATGTLDLDTGDFTGKDSKKDSRNERRDEVLQSAADAIELLAQILGADIRSFTGLQVEAGKKQIETSIIDTRTGQAIAVGRGVDDQDIEGAIDQLLDRALDTIIEGGDERLRAIAEALSGAGVPIETLIDTLGEVDQALALVEEPQSQFIEGLNAIIDAFDKATSVSDRFSAATRDLAEAQLEALDAYAKTFDDRIAEETTRLQSPIRQDALDLADSQKQLFEEATALNQALQDAAELLAQSTTQGAASSRFDPSFYLARYPDVARGADRLNADDRNYLSNLGYESTPQDYARYHFDVYGRNSGRVGAAPQEVAANDNVTGAVDRALEAQQRLADVTELVTLQWVEFIERSADTPEALRAMTQAIEELKTEAQDLPLDFDALTEALSNAKVALGVTLDQTLETREIELTQPLRLRVREIFDQQAAFIETAEAGSANDQDLQGRLSNIFDLTVLELNNLIEAAGNAPDALQAALEALVAYEDELRASGADTTLIERQIEQGREALRQSNTEAEGDRLLRLVSTPASEFRQLLDRLQGFTERAQISGSDLSLTQRANEIEIDRFLSSLSDAEITQLGDVYGQINESLGEGALVLRQLDDAFSRFVENRSEEIDKLESEARRAGNLSDDFGEYGLSLERQFGGRLPQQDVDLFLGELNNLLATAEDTGATVDQRLDAAQEGRGVAQDLIDSAIEAYGGTARTGEIIDFVQEAVARFEGVTEGIETERTSLVESLNREYDKLVDIENAIKSTSLGGELAGIISSALDSGQITSEPFVELLSQIVTLSRAAQIDRGDLTDAIKNVAVDAFSGEVTIGNTVTIDDAAMRELLGEIRDTLNEIENNQRQGGTESRIGLNEAA